jgi:hypothetical protein
MSEPTALPASETPVADELQRCLLRLQQYERLLKAILASQEISGTIDTALARQAARAEEFRTASLGTLVKEFLGSYVSQEGKEVPEPPTFEQEALATGQAVFRFRMSMEMSDEGITETKAALRELVALRNDIVHHLIERFNVWTREGCVAAVEHLIQSYSHIDKRFEELRGWAEPADSARAMSASFMQSDVYQDLVVNGHCSRRFCRVGRCGHSSSSPGSAVGVAS